MDLSFAFKKQPKTKLLQKQKIVCCSSKRSSCLKGLATTTSNCSWVEEALKKLLLVLF
jgi:hypothetical protein